MTEQVQNEEEETDGLDSVDDDGTDTASLIAAAEAAAKGLEETPSESKPKAKTEDGDTERDDKGRFVPKKEASKSEKPKTEEKPKPSSVIAAELAKREEARAARSQFEGKLTEAESLLQQLQSRSREIDQERAALAKERAELAAARRDPAAFLAQQGWTADQFIDSATRAKDPIYQETVALREIIQKREADIAELRNSIQQLTQHHQGRQEQETQAVIRQELDEFFSSIPQDSPVWEDYEDKDVLIYTGRKVREAYHKKTGKVASPKELGEYLHYKSLSKREGSPQQAAGKVPSAGKARAKVPRALGSVESSERRGGTGSKHVHDMSREEERAYLADVASQALHEE